MFYWFEQKNGRNNKLPKVSSKINNKSVSNQRKFSFPEKNKTITYSKYSPLPAINSKYPNRKLERQRTYIVTNPIFVKPTKQRKKPLTFKEFKKELNKNNKNNKNENGMIWVDL